VASNVRLVTYLIMLHSYRIIFFITLLLISFSGFSKNNERVSDFLLEEKNDVQMFVLLKYTQLSSELITGKGEYLDSLLYLIQQQKPRAKKNIILKKLRQYLMDSRDIFHFSMQVKKYSTL